MGYLSKMWRKGEKKRSTDGRLTRKINSSSTTTTTTTVLGSSFERADRGEGVNVLVIEEEILGAANYKR